MERAIAADVGWSSRKVQCHSSVDSGVNGGESLAQAMKPLGADADRREVSDRTIAAAAKGRHLAFETIVRTYDVRLRVLAYSLLGDREAMDDALQEVYLKAYRGLSGFRRESRLSTWLYRITYTTCISRLRVASAVREVSLDEGDGDGAPSPPDLAELVALRGDLARAVRSLPAELRMCVLLVYREGLSYEEAAAVFGVAPGTIGWRLSAARRALRAALLGEDGR